MSKGEHTRQAILAAAVELLGQAGPDGFSAAALAQAAGVSKATLFHHFDGMDAIPLAAFEEIWLRALRQPGGAAAEAPALRPYLEALGEEVLTAAREQRAFFNAYFVFLTQALFKPALRERLAAGSGELQAALSAELAARLPGLAPAETEATAQLIAVALDGLGLHALALSGEPALRRAWARLVDLLAPAESS
ncbi:MAG TPA: TetR/AcrR family transcriptional regulator [Herpetosiphonaceae bacterium]